MRLVFVLPCIAKAPVGGFKIVYEYANRLSDRGHQVTVAHMVGLEEVGTGILASLRRKLKFYVRSVQGRHSLVCWFELRDGVRVQVLPDLQCKRLLGVDIVVATAWQTAELLARVPASRTARGYLIQHLETWGDHSERVMATWRAPLKKAVIARWLQEIATSLGQDAAYLPNGLNFDRFPLNFPIIGRPGPSVMMLYHSADNKGSDDGLAALKLVQSVLPHVRTVLFGVPERPTCLPPWVEYHCQPDQTLLCDLYNRTQVFLAPSWYEGWGLPASEALMCGAALAATDVGGHREFAHHEKTALLSAARDPAKLAENVLRLLQDDQLRYRLALQGHQAIQSFTWESAVDGMEDYLRSAVAACQHLSD